MLKKCTLIAVFLLFTSSVFAFEQGSMLLSPRIGFGINNTKIDESGIDNELSMAWNIGLDFNYFFMDNFSFLAGLLYESETISYKESDPDIGEIKSDLNFSYITIPIGIRYFFAEHFLVGGGLYYAFSNDASISGSLGGMRMSIDIDSENDFGLFIDLGAIYKLSEQGALSAYIRFKQGLTEFEPKFMGYSMPGLRTQTITLNFAYSFMF